MSNGRHPQWEDIPHHTPCGQHKAITKSTKNYVLFLGLSDDGQADAEAAKGEGRRGWKWEFLWW